MSGEVRFTHESGHRVPHDPLIGLDRSIDLLEQVIDSALPYSNEETAAYFLMGNTLSRRGNFPEAIRYYEQELQRGVTLDQRMQALREMGARSEEHTSELQSQFHLVCRLLLEKKKK